MSPQPQAPQFGITPFSAQERKLYCSRAHAILEREAKRLGTGVNRIEFALRCGCFIEDISACGNELVFEMMLKGRSPKITKRGRYEGADRPSPAMQGTMAAVIEQRQRERRRQRKAA